jgi:uncharacterized protein (TIGR02284 family)
MKDANDPIETLNTLIETCRDGEHGFRTAAEGVSDPSTRSLFEQLSRERGQCALELQHEVRRLGGDPERAGSVSGAMHRGWINIKSLVTGKDEAAIVAEAERGEDAAVAAYDQALRGGLPPGVHAIVERQYRTVKAAHDRVRDLERATSR